MSERLIKRRILTLIIKASYFGQKKKRKAKVCKYVLPIFRHTCVVFTCCARQFHLIIESFGKGP